MLCITDKFTVTSLTFAPRAESSNAKFIYSAWASGRTGTSLELDNGVGVMGSKGESTGVGADSVKGLSILPGALRGEEE